MIQEACKYCGQINMIDLDEEASEQERMEAAIMKCDCEDAKRYKNMEIRRKKAAGFFMAIEEDEQISSLLLKAIDIVALVEKAAAVDVKLSTGERYHIGLNSKGNLITGYKLTTEKKEES